ncbi:hypothetical protein [Sphaerisporangium fuscum]|uniref:hypothetical protein n=1 Tax=Sphaerisporangium fuscum TaxID=2835868 RepID=UPI001BDDC20B|nr:hypothetical protein [Sphaerisporangium fuscum]
MPTREHEILLELIQERPSLAADLLEFVQPGAVPAFSMARVESGDLKEHTPTEYRADTVVSLHSGERSVTALIVEVQRGKDTNKHWSWPAYLATLRARLRCPVMLLVVSPSRQGARWCGSPIPLGHPGLVLTPLVLGPDEVPVIIDPDQAQANPELSVLSALLHSRDPEAEKVLAAMLDGLEHIELEQAQGYIDEVLAILPSVARRLLEAMLSTRTREYKSDYARHYYGKGEAKMLLAVLSARGIDVPDDARARITACTGPPRPSRSTICSSEFSASPRPSTDRAPVISI